MALLSVTEFRTHVTSSLGTEALQLLLDAAEQAIIARYGEVDDSYGLEEIVDGGNSYIFLRRRAASIDSITELDGTTETELDADDFRLRGDGLSVLRLGTGTNPRTWWGAPITVAYAPLDDVADRKRVQIALVQLDLNFVPGNSSSEQVGSWLESRNASGSFDYGEEREKILNSLLGVASPLFA